MAKCVADAGRPQEDHILAALDEPELVQAFDLLAAERRLKREVEVAQLFDRGQTARAHRGLQPSIVSQLNLRGQQLLNGFGRGERAAVDTVGLVFNDAMSLSEDGKTLTSTIRVSSPQGDVDLVVVFDKQ